MMTTITLIKRAKFHCRFEAKTPLLPKQPPAHKSYKRLTKRTPIKRLGGTVAYPLSQFTLKYNYSSRK